MSTGRLPLRRWPDRASFLTVSLRFRLLQCEERNTGAENTAVMWQARQDSNLQSSASEESAYLFPSVPSVPSADSASSVDSVSSVLSECSVPSVDSESSEEFYCPRNLRQGESGRRAFGRFQAPSFAPSGADAGLPLPPTAGVVGWTLAPLWGYTGVAESYRPTVKTLPGEGARRKSFFCKTNPLQNFRNPA